MCSEYVLTEDATRDLEKIEDYVQGYADESFVDGLENKFFNVFERLVSEALQHPVHQFDKGIALLHEYRSVNVYHYKVFYYLRDDTVVIYRIRHLVSDFTRIEW